jgi:hypothetical protein
MIEKFGKKKNKQKKNFFNLIIKIKNINIDNN